MNKVIIGVILLIVVAAGGFFLFKNSAGTSSPSTSTQQSENTSALNEKSENQETCEKIVSIDTINTFSGYQYEYQEEVTGFSGDFACFFLTSEGTGSRTLDYKMVSDPEKIEFEAAKGIGENEPALNLGEAYYTKGEFPESKLPELSLHVHKDGKTYIVDVIQYKSEAETKAFMKDILTNLMAEV